MLDATQRHGISEEYGQRVMKESRLRQLLSVSHQLHGNCGFVAIFLSLIAEVLGRAKVYETIAQELGDVTWGDSMIDVVRSLENEIMAQSENLDAKWAACVALKQEVGNILDDSASSNARRSAWIRSIK